MDQWPQRLAALAPTSGGRTPRRGLSSRALWPHARCVNACARPFGPGALRRRSWPRVVTKTPSHAQIATPSLRAEPRLASCGIRPQMRKASYLPLILITRTVRRTGRTYISATLAQLVEHALRKRMVAGSIPAGGLCCPRVQPALHSCARLAIQARNAWGVSMGAPRLPYP